MAYPTGQKTNCVLPVNNQSVEDRFGIPLAVAAVCAVMELSDGSALILFYGSSINTSNFSGVEKGVIVDIKAGKVYTRYSGGSWTGITYTGS